jgi:uncharacterized protein
MNESHMITITRELNLNLPQVSAVADLLADGATIPFIARYRKEATGSLDEVVVAQVRDRLEQLAELQKRREAILKSLEENGHLTDALRDDRAKRGIAQQTGGYLSALSAQAPYACHHGP